MDTFDYAAVIEQLPGEMVSIVFPDFPAVTSAAASMDEVDEQAADALGSAVDAYLADGVSLPPPSVRVAKGARLFRVDLSAVPPTVRRIPAPATAAE